MGCRMSVKIQILDAPLGNFMESMELTGRSKASASTRI